jgi:thiol:disulfide interchange protein
MQVPSGGKILGFFGFVLLAAASFVVHEWLGQAAGFRFWGLALLVAAVVFTARRTIQVTLGNTALTPLAGWRKAYVLVPAYAIGTVVSLWPHQVACAINLRGYLCA